MTKIASHGLFAWDAGHNPHYGVFQPTKTRTPGKERRDATLIDPATPPTHVEALIATWRYLKYDLEQAIMTLRHKEPLPLTQRHDLIAYMEDILDRGKRMERTATTTI